MPLGLEIGLGSGHIVLNGDPAPPPTERDTAAPTFEIYGRRLCLRRYKPRPMSTVAKRSPISATAELLSVIPVPLT